MEEMGERMRKELESKERRIKKDWEECEKGRRMETGRDKWGVEEKEERRERGK